MKGWGEVSRGSVRRRAQLLSPCRSPLHLGMRAQLVSNSAPTWSSRCCFTAGHFKFGKSLGRNVIRIEPNWKRAQSEMSPIGNEPCVALSPCQSELHKYDLFDDRAYVVIFGTRQMTVHTPCRQTPLLAYLRASAALSPGGTCSPPARSGVRRPPRCCSRARTTTISTQGRCSRSSIASRDGITHVMLSRVRSLLSLSKPGCNPTDSFITEIL